MICWDQVTPIHLGKWKSRFGEEMLGLRLTAQESHLDRRYVWEISERMFEDTVVNELT